MRFQALVKVFVAHDGVGDSRQDQDHSDDGKNGHCGPDRKIKLDLGAVVHTDQFEDEIGESSIVEELRRTESVLNKA